MGRSLLVWYKEHPQQKRALARAGKPKGCLLYLVAKSSAKALSGLHSYRDVSLVTAPHCSLVSQANNNDAGVASVKISCQDWSSGIPPSAAERILSEQRAENGFGPRGSLKRQVRSLPPPHSPRTSLSCGSHGSPFYLPSQDKL